MFLDKILEEKKENQFIDELNKKYLTIQKERNNIAVLIEKEVDSNKSKKEIIDNVITKTNMSKNQIKNIIDEYTFNKKFDSSFNINEINHLKSFFKFNNIKDDKDICKIVHDTKHLESIFKETNFMEKNKKTKHTFSLDEDGELLFQEAKNIVELIIDKPVKNKSEIFYWVLVDFISNNIYRKE